MSHWTKVKTKIRDLDYLKKGLSRMGLAFQEGNFTITQYGTSHQAQLKLDTAVGLACEADGTWAMVGDFYHSNTASLHKYYRNNQQFDADLSTAYAIEQTKGQLEEQQFFCSENADAEVSKSDGLIHMMYTRY